MDIFSNVDSRSRNSFITPWSFVHFIVGILIWLWVSVLIPKKSYTTKFLVLIIIHTLYEVKDLYKSYIDRRNDDWGNNSLLNSIGDTVSAIIGFVLASASIKNVEVVYAIFGSIIVFIFVRIFARVKVFD